MLKINDLKYFSTIMRIILLGVPYMLEVLIDALEVRPHYSIISTPTEGIAW